MIPRGIVVRAALPTFALGACAAVLLGAWSTADTDWQSAATHLAVAYERRQDTRGTAIDVLRVTGVPLARRSARLSDEDALQTAMRVYPSAVGRDPSLPSIRGRMRVAGTAIEFVPHYPLVPGAEYRIELDAASLQDGAPLRRDGASPAVELTVAIPGVAGEPARVLAIHPGDVVPENLLKFHVHFSRAMQPWEPTRYVRLVDGESGLEEPGAFYVVREGLWSTDGTRVTLFLDPGRVKRGLRNHEAFGSPLRVGRRYRVEIAPEWPDASGRRLAAGYTHEFTVGSADRRRPEPARWRIEPPTGDDGALTVVFDEALDHVVALRSITLVDGYGNTVPGHTVAEPDLPIWRFRPQGAWRPGRYRLLVDPGLEDLAGNTPQRLFDVDLDRADQDLAASARTPFLDFTLGEPALARPTR